MVDIILQRESASSALLFVVSDSGTSTVFDGVLLRITNDSSVNLLKRTAPKYRAAQ